MFGSIQGCKDGLELGYTKVEESTPQSKIKKIAMKITGGNQEAQDIKKEKFKLLDVKKHIRGAPEWCT
jgi:hypothetical protein